MRHKEHVVYDPLYGFIRLTNLEYEIIHSPFYQRLRWIKQLGFSFYTFPGAEHSRFGHSIGVMFNAHEILRSIGKAVPDEKLFDDKALDKATLFHKNLRISALLHDIGTFPFSHTTEMGYIEFGETHKSKNNGKNHPDDHEHLGSYIIKRTDYPGGLTHILQKYGLDPQHISNLVKGVDKSTLANQILHSEVDCDRMDYLLRDAHYTGLKYGNYDRDFLLYHFTVSKVGDEEVLAIKQNALHCVEDFLSARFAWYSQIIRSSRGARFDALAEKLTLWMLEKKHIYRYSDLLEMVESSPMDFFSFNDQYFNQTLLKIFLNGSLDKSPRIKEMAESLLFDKSPRSIRLPEFQQRILNQDDEIASEKVIKKATEKVEQLNQFIEKNGDEQHWIVSDLPKKKIIFVKSQKRVIKDTNHPNILLERDPVKIQTNDGNVCMLAEVESSIISRLENTYNFVPNVFCSDTTYDLLEKSGLL